MWKIKLNTLPLISIDSYTILLLEDITNNSKFYLDWQKLRSFLVLIVTLIQKKWHVTFLQKVHKHRLCSKHILNVFYKFCFLQVHNMFIGDISFYSGFFFQIFWVVSNFNFSELFPFFPFYLNDSIFYVLHKLTVL
jgi:hypothetical protein